MAGSDYFLSSKALREVQQALTLNSRFGVPRYTTALLPATPGVGALAFDTTTASFKGSSDGTTWAALGGGAGDVVGPASNTSDGNVVLFSGTSGKLLKDSLINVNSDGSLFVGNAGNATGVFIKPSGTISAQPKIFTVRGGSVFGGNVSGADLEIGGGSKSGSGIDGNVILTVGQLALTDNLGLNLGTTVGTTRPLLQWNTTQTPDTGMLLTGSTSNHWVIAERADNTFDFAHAQQTNPTLFIHSAAQSTTQWLGLAHDGTNGVLSVGTGSITTPANFQVGGLDMTGGAANGIIRSNALLFFGGTSPSAVNGSIVGSTAQTPDAPMLLTGSNSNSWILAEGPDSTFDFAHALAANPTLFIQSRNQSTTEFVGISHNGGGAVINNQGTVALTEAGAAETVATITTATTQMTGGRIDYVVRATDATDRAARAGSFNFVCENAAGTVTATLGASDETNDGSVLIATGGKTLTYAIIGYVGTANQLKIAFNIDSSMVVSAASITYTLVLNGPGTVA